MSIGDEADFSKSILEEARQEADGILDLARREAERILQGAREELDKIYIAESPQAKKQQAATRQNQIIAAAELESRRTILLSQEEFIQRVQEQVRNRLEEFRRDQAYAQILQTSILQGLQELEGDAFEVCVAPQDRPLVTAAMLNMLQQQSGKSVTLAEETRDGMIGAFVQRVDGRVVCDNSFQAVMQREQASIRLLIAGSLFGETDL